MSLIDAIEWTAGKLIVNAGRLRANRADPGDAHEMRHLYAALRAGDSTPCGRNGVDCHLDRGLIHDFNLPSHPTDPIGGARK
jgi:hypothetical protein